MERSVRESKHAVYIRPGAGWGETKPVVVRSAWPRASATRRRSKPNSRWARHEAVEAAILVAARGPGPSSAVCAASANDGPGRGQGVRLLPERGMCARSALFAQRLRDRGQPEL